LEQQREIYMQEQEKLRRSHAQAADVLHLKIQSLEARLQEGKQVAQKHFPARASREEFMCDTYPLRTPSAFEVVPLFESVRS
jgi:hypothetical protein